ncbi:hypothetical protein MNEG_2857 [Monoraphidium neglectum]|jgi:hypothetical protein|uniref:Uncharacterized protein n=1 Tax=Monoraphidium neglectum TaxID=145388 RepID=A0A0D2K3R4_9CHLO|nr:hypothetical protein MNEG_2857 [Monoraphidium neglectum]KIZ05093.1 hypothetical protein MNEG_2857 [Monoraphidium neglectum]|eukprot:XP_013904112.1 hypothetical protein MNEG_2857 [Monoraphidium neglectum]
MALLASHASQARLVARSHRVQASQSPLCASRISRRGLACRAQQETEAGASADTTQQAAPAKQQEQQQQQQQQQQQPAAAPAPTAPLLAKGQGTAVWTGAISIIFGVAYLALVFFLDSRGGEMLPPPPEAFLP